MAHVEKYKAAATPHLSDHYTREEGAYSRDNIDRSLSVNNYSLDFVIKDDKKAVSKAQPEKPKNRVKQRIEDVEKSIGKKVRKDAVVMADMVLTIPENVPGEDEYKFFAYSYLFLGSKIGFENLLGCYVHKDEPNARTHAHIPFTPILDGKFNYKKLCPRAFYQTLHRELGDYLEERLGYRPEIELGEEKAAQKALSSVPQEKLNETRAALDKELKETADRLELLRQREAEETAAIKAIETEIADESARITGYEAIIQRCRRGMEVVRNRITGLAGSIKQLFENGYRTYCDRYWVSPEEFLTCLKDVEKDVLNRFKNEEYKVPDRLTGLKLVGEDTLNYDEINYQPVYQHDLNLGEAR